MERESIGPFRMQLLMEVAAKAVKIMTTGVWHLSFDEMDIDGGTGNITVTSSQSLDGYMMDLDSGTGDITINGNDYDDEYEVNEHAKKHLVIDSGLGDIEVKY